MNFTKELEKSFKRIESDVPICLIDDLRSCDINDLWLYHFNFGIWIREKILTEDNKLFKIMQNANITEKDDMSDIILKTFYIHLKNQQKTP